MYSCSVSEENKKGKELDGGAGRGVGVGGVAPLDSQSIWQISVGMSDWVCLSPIQSFCLKGGRLSLSVCLSVCLCLYVSVCLSLILSLSLSLLCTNDACILYLLISSLARASC